MSSSTRHDTPPTVASDQAPGSDEAGIGSSYSTLFSGALETVETSILGEWAASLIRLALVLFCGAMYLFVTDHAGTIPWLAYAIVGVAGLYSLYLLWQEPYRRYDFLLSSLFVSFADAALVLGWIYATGSFASEYFPLLYASVVGFSFRYGPWETTLGASVHAAGYAGLLYLTGDLLVNLPTATLRIGFVYLIGALGLLLSMVAQRQTVAKESYKDLSDELAHQVSLHEATLDATEDGILVVDLHGAIVSYNDRFQEIWDLPDDVVEARDDEVAIEHVIDQVEDPQAFRDRVEELYANPQTEAWDEIPLKDGRILERHTRPQRLDGEVVGRVWSFRDVTEQRETKRELERSNEDLRQFASAVSHDVREPLRMIANYLELIEDRWETDDPELHGFLDHAKDGAHRLDRMIEGLLTYSRLDQAGERGEVVDLDEVLDDALKNLTVQIEEANAQIKADELPHVQGDASQLTMLFQNLVGNAIRYRGDEPPDIRIRSQPVGDRIRVSIEDNGVGIPPEEQEGIFEIFKQGSASRGTIGQGEGIGLAVCKRIVDRHGGQIRVESTPGKGSTFSFTLRPAPGGGGPEHRTGS